MSKASALSAAASADPSDITPVVVDPAGTPASRKLSLSNLVKSVKNLATITGAAESDILTVAQAVAEGRKLTWKEAMAIGRSKNDIQIGQWHESGGGGAGVFDPIAVLSQGGGTSLVMRAGSITGDPQHLRLDSGYRYSSQSCGVHLFPCLVKFYAKLTGGTAQMDQQLTMANVVASGMDPAVPSQNYARFRLFVNTSGDTHWQAQMNDGTAGQEQIAATSLAAGDTDWHWFMIRFNAAASVARFYIDGVLEATLDTAARYPAAGLGPMIYNRRFGGAGQYMHCARVWVVNAHRL